MFFLPPLTSFYGCICLLLLDFSTPSFPEYVRQEPCSDFSRLCPNPGSAAREERAFLGTPKPCFHGAEKNQTVVRSLLEAQCSEGRIGTARPLPVSQSPYKCCDACFSLCHYTLQFVYSVMGYENYPTGNIFRAFVHLSNGHYYLC